MHHSVAYDLTRLCFAPPTSSPRGIDRVDLALAEHFFIDRSGPCVAVLPTPWGVRCLDRKYGAKVVEWARGRWRERSNAQDDAKFRYARARLLSQASETSDEPRSKPVGSEARRVLCKIEDLVATLGLPAGKPVTKATPNGSIYLNIGHVGLAVNALTSWLGKRPDIRSVIMLHDLIPVLNPEFVTASGQRFHEAMVANSARYASGLIVSTQVAKRQIVETLRERGNSNLKALAAPLPVSSAFLEPAEVDQELQSVPYFVFCGMIEPRKNFFFC